MDFAYLFRILIKRKWIIIVSTVTAAAVAYVFTLNQPSKYRSTAQVATGYTTYDPVKLVNENADYWSQETKFNNAIVTFTSPGVINLLSYNLMLHDLTQTPFTQLKEEDRKKAFAYISKDDAIKALKIKIDSLQMVSSSSKEDRKLLNLLWIYRYDPGSVLDNLSVTRFQRSDYLNISYVSKDPSLSAFAVNTAFEQFNRYYGSNRNKSVAESVDTLRAIMDRKKQILDEKNRILQQAGITTGSTNSQSLNDLSIIPNLEAELTNQRSKLSTLESDLRKINQKLNALDSRPSNENNTAVNDEIIQLRTAMNAAYADYLKSNDQSDYNKYKTLNTKYQQKVLALRSTSTDNSKNPVDEKIDLQSQKTDKEIDIQSTSSFIATLQGKIQSLKASGSSSTSRSAAGESLIKETQLANQEYLDAQQKYNAATDIGGASLNNFRLVVPGQPSLAPEPSRRFLIIALAGFAAFFTTIVIIIFLTYLDSSVRTPLIFQKNVNLKLISLVNFMNLKNKNIKDVIANTYVSTDSEEANRNNTFRESLRKLRYEIETSGKKIFLFTSTKKGQGKTTLIQALSYSMSLSKKRVLIIDTNFCNNDLTVQLDAEPILEKIIPHNFDDKNLVEEIKKRSKDLGLGSIYAIGSAGGDYTPSEILPRENLLHHLQALTSYFDYVFLEGPPLNDFSDSKELAQYVEGVIAVFSAQDVIKQIDRQSISFFKEDLNGKFCGSILNMVDLKNVNVI
jgi:succinoglycan biosynthesis transport protein ExoP